MIKFVIRLRCWWFGCEPDYDQIGNVDPDFYTCQHCGEYVMYSNLVRDIRHNRFKAWCNYWLYRKWWPTKCDECGRRWRECDCDEECMPF